MPVALFEVGLFVTVLVVGITQVIWPIWRGTPLFPVFRSEGRLLREAERERQRQIELQLSRDLTRQTLRETDWIKELHDDDHKTRQ